MQLSITNSTPPREFLPISLQITFTSLNEVQQFMHGISKGMNGDPLTPPLTKEGYEMMTEIIHRIVDELKRQGF